VTVSAIMSATTLSRKSFYVYFADRPALITALVAPMRAETDAAVEQWERAADPVAAGRRALHQAAMLYHRDGAVLKALAEASQRDPEAAAVWQGFTAPLVAVATAKIAAATSTNTGLDAEATARALVSMNVHYFLDRLVGAPASDIAPTVETLAVIWERTIYLRAAAQSRPVEVEATDARTPPSAS
jgi:AcrR family transcriptional regulator